MAEKSTTEASAPCGAGDAGEDVKMPSEDPLMYLRGAGYIVGGFPAPGLRRTVRHITGHNAEGKSVFVSTDCGNHHRMMGDQQALANIMWSTHATPVDMNNDKDLKEAEEREASSPRPIRLRHQRPWGVHDLADMI